MQNLNHLTTIFANAKIGNKFKWGQEDCNTLALDYIDFVYTELPNITNEVRGKYNNSREAKEFYMNFKYTWHNYLLEIGYAEVQPLFFQAGDLHIHRVGTSLDAVSINLGNENIIADPKKGICLTSFFYLNENFSLKAYRYRG